MASRREWVRRIAEYAAADLGASLPWEIVQSHIGGSAEWEELTDAERDRIEAAIQEVIGRLYRISALRD